MSGWNNSDRRQRLPPDWAARRAKQLKLDGGRCTWYLPRSGKRCPRPATDVDHKVEMSDRHEPGRDLQSLCEEHHKAKTARAAQMFKRAQKQKALRKPEAHPGALS